MKSGYQEPNDTMLQPAFCRFRKNSDLCKPNSSTMTKKIFCLFILSALIISACNNGTKNDGAKTNADTVKVTVLTFEKQADKFVNKPVFIEGTVLHICKHGGERLFLADGNDSITVEVTAGPKMTRFEESMIGSKIRITGMLKEERIDAKYLNEWEAEIKKPQENHNVGIHTGTKGHEDEGVKEKLDQIAALRDELKKSGKDHLSNFSIEASKYVEIK